MLIFYFLYTPFHKRSGSYIRTSCGSGSYCRTRRYIRIRMLLLLRSFWIGEILAIPFWSANGNFLCMHCPRDCLFSNTIFSFLWFLLYMRCSCTARLGRCGEPEAHGYFFFSWLFPRIVRPSLFPAFSTNPRLWSFLNTGPWCLSGIQILPGSIYRWCLYTRRCPVLSDQNFFLKDYGAFRQILLKSSFLSYAWYIAAWSLVPSWWNTHTFGMLWFLFGWAPLWFSENRRSRAILRILPWLPLSSFPVVFWFLTAFSLYKHNILNGSHPFFSVYPLSMRLNVFLYILWQIDRGCELLFAEYTDCFF